MITEYVLNFNYCYKILEQKYTIYLNFRDKKFKLTLVLQ